MIKVTLVGVQFCESGQKWSSYNHHHHEIVVVQLLNSLQPHELQHARLPCPSPSLRACSNSRPLSQWCHPAVLCRPLLLPSIFPSIRVYSLTEDPDVPWDTEPQYLPFPNILLNRTGCDLLCLTFTKHDTVQILLCPFVSQECVLQSRCPLFQLVYLFTSLRRFYLFPSFWRLWINSL